MRPRNENSELPPVMRAGVYWWLGLSACFGLAAVAWVVLRGPLGLPRDGWFRFVPLALGLVPVVVLTPLWVLRTRRIRRDLLSSGGRLCTHCAYELSSLPGDSSSGVCPECGEPYDFEADRRLWENVGALHHGPGPAPPSSASSGVTRPTSREL